MLLENHDPHQPKILGITKESNESMKACHLDKTFNTTYSKLFISFRDVDQQISVNPEILKKKKINQNELGKKYSLKDEGLILPLKSAHVEKKK